MVLSWRRGKDYHWKVYNSNEIKSSFKQKEAGESVLSLAAFIILQEGFDGFVEVAL